MTAGTAAKLIAQEIGLCGTPSDYSPMEAIYWAQKRIEANQNENALLEALVRQINAAENIK